MSGSTDPALTVTNAYFVSTFTQFDNPVRYPDAEVTMYLALANKMLPFPRWLDMLPLASMWWAAHFLTLDAIDAGNAASGKLGQPLNPIASKSVGSASISFETTGAAELNAGHWNSTTYGRRFIRMARMAGMGGIHIGGTPSRRAGGLFPPY